MGRSYLSIKLALAFGLIVGALVLEAERSEAAAPEPQSSHRSVIVSEPLQPPHGAEVVCMWRGCPLSAQRSGLRRAGAPGNG